VGASAVRKIKIAHKTGGHRVAVSFIEYATLCYLLFPLQKMQLEHREHVSLRKSITIEDLGA